MIRRTGLIAMSVYITACVSTALQGALITSLDVNVVNEGSGLFDYAFSLSNSTLSDLSVINLNVGVSADAELHSLSGPAGWDAAYSSGDTVISWGALDIQSAIAPGSTADFRFVSHLGPASADFSIVGFDPNTFAFDSNGGTISSAIDSSPGVPEPSSIVLWGAAGALLLLLRGSWGLRGIWW
jgi:hypothetical protein